MAWSSVMTRFCIGVALLAALAACKKAGRVSVHQYDTVAAPVVGHGVRIHLGDLDLGRWAPLRVLAPNGDILADGVLEVGDELPFRYGGQPYVVRARRYEDHTLHEDVAHLEVIRREPATRPDLVAIPEGGSASVPGRPQDRITIGAIEVDRLINGEVTFANGPTLSPAFGLGRPEHFELGGAEYHLTVIALAFEPGGVDRAFVRFRPGRR